MWWKIGIGLLQSTDDVKCLVDANSFDEALAVGRKEYGKEINSGQPYDKNRQADKILFKQARKIRCKDAWR